MGVRNKLSLCQTPEIFQVIVTVANFTLTNIVIIIIIISFLAIMNNAAMNSLKHAYCCT